MRQKTEVRPWDDDVESGVKGFLYNIEESEMGKKGKRASRATATVVAAVPVSLGPREWLWRKIVVLDERLNPDSDDQHGPFAYWIARDSSKGDSAARC